MMKHIKTFDNFLYEKEVSETLYEASHAGRAWSGKIENIDKLLSWMYDKGILTKTEQAEKDRTFRQYYRYYNDGDIPQGLRGLSDEKVELYIEEKVEEFIKKVLAKYTGKYDRRDFRLDTILGDLYTLRNQVAGHTTVENGVTWEPNPHGLLNYWGKKINTGNSEFEKMLGELRPLYDVADKDATAALDKAVKDGWRKDKSWTIPSSSSTIAHRRETLQADGLWPDAAEKKYQAVKDHMLKMAEILDTVIEATAKLKQETNS